MKEVSPVDMHKTAVEYREKATNLSPFDSCDCRKFDAENILKKFATKYSFSCVRLLLENLMKEPRR